MGALGLVRVTRIVFVQRVAVTREAMRGTTNDMRNPSMFVSGMVRDSSRLAYPLLPPYKGSKLPLLPPHTHHLPYRPLPPPSRLSPFPCTPPIHPLNVTASLLRTHPSKNGKRSISTGTNFESGPPPKAWHPPQPTVVHAKESIPSIPSTPLCNAAIRAVSESELSSWATNGARTAVASTRSPPRCAELQPNKFHDP